MPSKDYIFDFYKCSTFNSNHNAIQKTPIDIITNMLNKFLLGDSCVKPIGKNHYELRYLQSTDYGFKGIIGKHRQTDLPHVARIGGEEREIDLDVDENLLEKSYFSYYSDYSILILQRNYFCINSSNMGKFLTTSTNVTTLDPIIEPADLQWLLDNHVQIRTAEVAIARPTNPELFNNVNHDFNNSIISTLNGSGTALLNLSLRGNARSDVAEERYLASTLKGALRELQTTFDVKKCKLLLENDETLVSHPVDLVSDRLFYIKQIETAGRYPSSIEMWAALEESRNAKEQEIIRYFGDLEQERIA